MVKLVIMITQITMLSGNGIVFRRRDDERFLLVSYCSIFKKQSHIHVLLIYVKKKLKQRRDFISLREAVSILVQVLLILVLSLLKSYLMAIFSSSLKIPDH